MACRYGHLHAVVYAGASCRRSGRRGPRRRGHPHPLPPPRQPHLLQVGAGLNVLFHLTEKDDLMQIGVT